MKRSSRTILGGQHLHSCPTLHSRTHFGDHESLDLSRMWDVGTDAQVDHGTTAIDGSRGTVRDLGLNDVLLVFVVLKSRYQNQRFTVGHSSSVPQTSSRASPWAPRFAQTFASP